MCGEEQLANKCASKKMWYYCTNLHIVAQDRSNGLPKAEFGLTGAAEHDLTAFLTRFAGWTPLRR